MNPEGHQEHQESLKEKFDAFLLANPKAYPTFCRVVDRLIAAGKKHYSADAVCHVMRYETAIDGREEEEFKVNNNYVRFFSRKWQADHPDYPDFFQNRTIKTA